MSEFKVGDAVTFKPYEIALKTVVRAVLPNYFGDGRMVYFLKSPFRHDTVGECRITHPAVISYTPGECIVESTSFQEECSEELGV